MVSQIELSKQVLHEFLAASTAGALAIDRPEIVAHATLSAFVHHWPRFASLEMKKLLEATSRIKEVERSRWMTQRRIAIAKLARELCSDSAGLKAF